MRPTEAASGAGASGPTGVLLLNLGGPDRPESVQPFLRELFNDPGVLDLPGGAPVRRALAWWIATRRAPQVTRNYLEVGWSPLLPRTRAQERALEARLNELAANDGVANAATPPSRSFPPFPPFIVRTAMRYWHPRAEEAVAGLLAAGVRRIVALPLYPHFSRATTGSSLTELQTVVARHAPRLEPIEIRSYADDPAYLDALTACVVDGLALARAHPSAAAAGEPTLLFSAHGLPQRIIDAGDPYLREIEATRAGVLARLRARAGFAGEEHLAFQSRAGPVRWLEPTSEATIRRLAARGRRSLVVVPISFVSDHIETVHEIDCLLAARARDCGVNCFVRAPALDVRADFIDALAQQVRRRLALAESPSEEVAGAGRDAVAAKR